MSSINRTWIKALDLISKEGRNTGPRSLETKELPMMTVVDMNNPILRVPDRNLGYKFMAAEAAWILEGRNDLESIRKYSKDILNYSQDGMYFSGAYGPKIRDQISWAVMRLRCDPMTRQCVINIWRERPDLDKDIPCTLAVQFYFRSTKLEMHAYMRSSDAWLGWPYDVFNFSQLAVHILLHLKHFEPTWTKMELGNLIIHAGSMHIYKMHWERVDNIIKDDKNQEEIPVSPEHSFSPSGEYATYDHIKWLWGMAKSGKLKDK